MSQKVTWVNHSSNPRLGGEPRRPRASAYCICSLHSVSITLKSRVKRGGVRMRRGLDVPAPYLSPRYRMSLFTCGEGERDDKHCPPRTTLVIKYLETFITII